ncbi:conserved hypothetical protein [Frankia canadensis]|uniref:Repeat protein (TIGR03847 family) n=1 Tax=Frankia canadensis TaxID=1836972 RepID=A0A2I2KRW5_9ACTN|nr:DUF3090 family protein [Frankia canadensis]SNQ48405.1 conserved hypothetical protein [Frankia canadensis]SOU55695.1 conserved hypothetical protein [Frankia canadensis]
MARRIHVFDPPRRFVAGTVGSPGARAFYLQVRDETRLVTVAVDKTQVSLLAEQVTEVLDELGARGVEAARAPAAQPVDADPLEQPVDPEFQAATIALGWDPRGERVVVEMRAAGDADAVAGFTDDPEGPDAVRVLLAAGSARAFAARSRRVVAAGRAPCPLCGAPLDDGHVCPRHNGHRS